MVDWPISRTNALRRFRSRLPAETARAPHERATTSYRRLHDPGETLVRSAGVVLAVASTGFAAYMIADTERQPQFAGLEHLAIYARPNMSAATRRTQTQLAADQQNKVDYTPVGSISEPRQEQPVPGFVLLGVNSGTALVRAPTAIIRVAQGDIVQGLGRVVSIERRGDKWVVVTPSGLIVSN